MIATIKGLTLVMWEKTMMPDSNYDSATKQWIKTGSLTEKTTYVLRDEFGSKIVFLSGNDFRKLEGKIVDVEVKLVYGEFGRKNKVSLSRISESE